VVAYGRLKTKENFKILTLKVTAVTYKRMSLTRGSKYSDLTGKLLVVWRTGHLREVVATRGSTVIHFLRGVIKSQTLANMDDFASLA